MSMALASDYPRLNEDQKTWLGQQIFTNECSAQLACLSSWSASESFPSLGIGHFIWFRADQDEIFEESFPALMRYFESRGVSIPSWITEANYAAPWKNRQEFLDQQQGPQLRELRYLLANTMALQTEFIILRFEAALNKILAASVEDEREDIAHKFYAVANAHPPYGMYALIDYVNFKGEGVSETERYAGQGWGLLQVLQGMHAQRQTLDAFVESARRTLQQRVSNAPAVRNEGQWLPGWNKRLDSYLPPLIVQEN